MFKVWNVNAYLAHNLMSNMEDEKSPVISTK